MNLIWNNFIERYKSINFITYKWNLLLLDVYHIQNAYYYKCQNISRKEQGFHKIIIFKEI